MGEGLVRHVLVARIWREGARSLPSRRETRDSIHEDLATFFEFFNHGRWHNALRRRTVSTVYVTARRELRRPSPSALYLSRPLDLSHFVTAPLRRETQVSHDGEEALQPNESEGAGAAIEFDRGAPLPPQSNETAPKRCYMSYR